MYMLLESSLTSVSFFSFFSLSHSAIKENKNASEIVKTVNLLITSLSTDFLWDYMTKCFEDSFRCLCCQTIVLLLKMPLKSYLCKIMKFTEAFKFWKGYNTC